MIALIICVVPLCIAAGILFVVYGPVPARQASFARHVPATRVATMPVAVPPIWPELAPAVAPPIVIPPIATPPAVRPAATAVEPPRERAVSTIPPGLAPFVRPPRGGALPPLRRAARGTDAPPPARMAPRTEPSVIIDDDFDLEELTHVDDR